LAAAVEMNWWVFNGRYRAFIDIYYYGIDKSQGTKNRIYRKGNVLYWNKDD
jgi:hypothetical protein